MTNPVRVERRVGQRFPFLLPVSLRCPASSVEGLGFTQDVSSRGVFFFTDAPLCEGTAIELTLQMPAEITLGESMRVRCRGQILRVTKPADIVETKLTTQPEKNTSQPQSAPAKTAETRVGVAVRFECYDYLPDSAEQTASFRRLSALHPHHEEEPSIPHESSARPLLG